MVTTELRKAVKLISELRVDLLTANNPEDFVDAIDYLRQARESLELSDKSIKHVRALRTELESSLIGYPHK